MKIVELMIREKMPNKEYFKDTEAASLLGIDIYQLRYWESEFPQLKGNKSGKGGRYYKKAEIFLLFSIKNLLIDKKVTISSAQRIIAQSVDLPLTSSSDMVQEASLSLDSEDEFDEQVHREYQEQAIRLEEELASEECDSKATFAIEDKPTAQTVHAISVLKESVVSLNEILHELDKYKESSFWQRVQNN